MATVLDTATGRIYEDVAGTALDYYRREGARFVIAEAGAPLLPGESPEIDTPEMDTPDVDTPERGGWVSASPSLDVANPKPARQGRRE